MRRVLKGRGREWGEVLCEKKGFEVGRVLGGGIEVEGEKVLGWGVDGGEGGREEGEWWMDELRDFDCKLLGKSGEGLEVLDVARDFEEYCE